MKPTSIQRVYLCNNFTVNIFCQRPTLFSILLILTCIIDRDYAVVMGTVADPEIVNERGQIYYQDEVVQAQESKTLGIINGEPGPRLRRWLSYIIHRNCVSGGQNVILSLQLVYVMLGHRLSCVILSLSAVSDSDEKENVLCTHTYSYRA